MPAFFGVVELTAYRRKKAVMGAFKRPPLHAIRPWWRFETREAFGKDNRVELYNQSRN